MAFTKQGLLDKAVEIAIAYGKGGSTIPPDTILQLAYEQLKKINDQDTNDR